MNPTKAHEHEFFDNWPSESYCRCGITWNQANQLSRAALALKSLAIASGAGSEENLYV